MAVRPPFFICPPGFELKEHRCMDLSLKDNVCPPDFRLSVDGFMCGKRFRTSPFTDCPTGFEIANGSCLRDVSVPEELLCPPVCISFVSLFVRIFSLIMGNVYAFPH